MGLVTIKQAQYITELIVLKSKLESEGIQCSLRNDITNNVLNYIPSVFVELQVSETDVPRVIEIMKQIEREF